MHPDRVAFLATAIVLATGMLWGLYWLPVRGLAGLGLSGAWGTLAITAAAALFLAPAIALRGAALAGADRMALAAVALGGAAFALYSIGFVHGRVAMIILLYFLTPVWSTLIGRYVIGWPVARLRLLAVAVGLAGLTVMLGGTGGPPLPEGLGEWMALLAGLLWSVATTGMRVRPPLDPALAAWVFALGGAATAALLAPLLAPWPGADVAGGFGAAVALAVLTGAFWWGLSVASLMWAAARLDPARVGILLMAEVLVGAATAAAFAGETMSLAEIAGGALVMSAAVLEVWPVRPRRAPGG